MGAQAACPCIFPRPAIHVFCSFPTVSPAQGRAEARPGASSTGRASARPRPHHFANHSNYGEMPRMAIRKAADQELSPCRTAGGPPASLPLPARRAHHLFEDNVDNPGQLPQGHRADNSARFTFPGNNCETKGTKGITENGKQTRQIIPAIPCRKRARPPPTEGLQISYPPDKVLGTRAACPGPKEDVAVLLYKPLYSCPICSRTAAARGCPNAAARRNQTTAAAGSSGTPVPSL